MSQSIARIVAIRSFAAMSVALATGCSGADAASTEDDQAAANPDDEDVTISSVAGFYDQPQWDYNTRTCGINAFELRPDGTFDLSLFDSYTRCSGGTDICGKPGFECEGDEHLQNSGIRVHGSWILREGLEHAERHILLSADGQADVAPFGELGITWGTKTRRTANVRVTVFVPERKERPEEVFQDGSFRVQVRYDGTESAKLEDLVGTWSVTARTWEGDTRTETLSLAFLPVGRDHQVTVRSDGTWKETLEGELEGYWGTQTLSGSLRVGSDPQEGSPGAVLVLMESEDWFGHSNSGAREIKSIEPDRIVLGWRSSHDDLVLTRIIP